MTSRRRSIWLVLAVTLGLVTEAHGQTPELLQLDFGSTRLNISRGEISQVVLQQAYEITVLVALDPALDDQIRTISRGHIGKPLVVRVCGAEIMRPVLMSELASATFVLAAPGLDLVKVAHKLKTGSCSARNG